MPAAAVRILAGWLNHLCGAGVPVKDADGERLVALASGDRPAAAILGALDPSLADDAALVAAVEHSAEALAAQPLGASKL
jgi:hypothetical protein